jgi:transcriptional regulator with XRE-family HTH domain
MSDAVGSRKRQGNPGWRRRGRRGAGKDLRFADADSSVLDVDVGQNLRRLRTERDLSLRALADASDLNINTLSLIENGRISPSVSTLQKLAVALGVPIAAFFEVGSERQSIIFQKLNQRPRAAFSHGTLEDLGTELAGRRAEPFAVTLEPGADSGETPIVHTGLEFVYCLEGSLIYSIEAHEYKLEPGDSLMFEARLPHRWRNAGSAPGRWLLVLCPADDRDHPTLLHFMPGAGSEEDAP